MRVIIVEDEYRIYLTDGREYSGPIDDLAELADFLEGVELSDGSDFTLERKVEFLADRLVRLRPVSGE